MLEKECDGILESTKWDASELVEGWKVEATMVGEYCEDFLDGVSPADSASPGSHIIIQQRVHRARSRRVSCIALLVAVLLC